MSETQAIETEAEVEIVAGEAGEEVEKIEAAAPEAIEIKVEDGDEPAPKKVSRFETRLRNKNNQISEAEKEKERIASELEATRAELELIKLRDKQQAETAPNEDDFDDPREYQKALFQFNDNRTAALVDERVTKAVQATQQQNNQAQRSQEQEKSIGNHYQRADSLNVKNYDELEGNAMSILGAEFVQTIIETTDNSELLLASIGASPGRAAEIASLAKINPAKAFAKAVSFPINSHLNGTSLKAPDPETKLSPGESTQLSGWELKLDKARDQAAVDGDFSYIAKVKKAAREAGVTL